MRALNAQELTAVSGAGHTAPAPSIALPTVTADTTTGLITIVFHTPKGDVTTTLTNLKLAQLVSDLLSKIPAPAAA